MKFTIRWPNRSREVILTRAEIERLQETLKTLLDQAIGGTVKAHDEGICFNWAQMYAYYSDSTWEHPYRVVQYLGASWKHSVRPGDTTCEFPVPWTRGYGTWSGPNLEMRVSFIRYMLKRLRDWKRRTPT